MDGGIEVSPVRPATPAEIRDWDSLVIANPDRGHVLQTRAWGEFKRAWGWSPHYLIAEWSGRQVAILELRRWVAGLGRVRYVPRGPGIDDPSQLQGDLRGSRRDGFLVKIDPEIPAPADTSQWSALGLRKAPNEVQNSNATILVDIAREDEALLASFKPKTRYNIRLAGRKGVRVRQIAVNDDTIRVMHRLMRETQSRAGFMLRPADYFAGYWRLQHAAGQGEFFFAFHGDEVLAGCFVTHFGTRGWYKDGGSSRRHRELMAPHLLQWEVMRWLRSHGVTTYDLVAVPPATHLQPDHPYFGLYRFKSGFNDVITQFTGTWDWPVSAVRYAAWNAVGERAARQWTYRVHSDFFY
jgi:lipid II:glycine glycyltransferase (peptidoglycan interpeptide bridge formation enzyme)